ncbi:MULTISPECIES: hypothetical protein [Micromonospora]|uniref:hypothetical protein n=1 Tax=Micromonospora TaxID=1873 RepID=UPI001374F909|nr:MULTISPECIES: hypothetical protein [unclassified Micromonospora]MBM0225297.1 hypothetical protein [Micromonospora sp. ATA51]
MTCPYACFAAGVGKVTVDRSGPRVGPPAPVGPPRHAHGIDTLTHPEQIPE